MKLKSFPLVSLCGFLCLSSAAFIACGKTSRRGSAFVGELAQVDPWTAAERTEFKTQCSVKKSIKWCECVAPILEANTNYSDVMKDSYNQPSRLQSKEIKEKIATCGTPLPPENDVGLTVPTTSPLPNPTLAPTIAAVVPPTLPESVPTTAAPTATATASPVVTAAPTPSVVPEITPEPTTVPELETAPAAEPGTPTLGSEGFQPAIMNCSGRASIIGRLPGVEPFCYIRLKKVSGSIDNYAASFVAEEGDCRVGISRSDILFAGFTFKYAMTDSGLSPVCKGKAVFKELSTGAVQELAINF